MAADPALLRRVEHLLGEDSTEDEAEVLLRDIGEWHEEAQRWEQHLQEEEQKLLLMAPEQRLQKIVWTLREREALLTPDQIVQLHIEKVSLSRISKGQASVEHVAALVELSRVYMAQVMAEKKSPRFHIPQKKPL